MSDFEDSTVTYIAVSSPYEDSSDMGSPGVEGPPMMPEDPHAYVVAIFQGPPSLDYVPGPEEPKQAPPSPVYLPYVPEPVYPEYILESDLEENDEEDPEEDPTNYPADRGDDGDDEKSYDDDDNVEEDKEDEDEEEEEEEHLAPADPTAVAFLVDQDPSNGEIEPFETDESEATPPSPPHPTYHTPSLPLPIPSPPPNKPTYIEAPLGFKATGIRQRDTSPSPVHETEIPKICLPLRKRPCRTAPTPRYEVRESSAAGAARQDGPAIARADLYGFVDMVDAAPGRLMSSELGYGITDTWDDLVGAIQEIAPTTLEGVNQRVIELVTTIDQQDGIMYSLLEDAREDRSLLRGRVNMLFRDRPYHTTLLMEEEARVSRVAWAQLMDASDKETGSDYKDAGSEPSETETAYRGTKTAEEVTGPDDRKMAPKRRTTRATPVTDTPTTTFVTNAQLQAMIDQGVTAALAARDATRNGDNSHTLGTGVRRNERVVRECTYQDFMKCQPLYFKGTEGVVELTQWFERMETVFHISNCSVENQIKFSTCTLLAGALTW
ncbi:hypothetical protein Tco_1212485 [Tanacetum coccineum]